MDVDLLVFASQAGETTAEFTVFLEYRETLQLMEVAIPLTVVAPVD